MIELPDKFPEAFKRVNGGTTNVKNLGITTFDEFLEYTQNELKMKSPRGGLTYKQKKSLITVAKENNLSRIYIKQEGYRNGHYYIAYRDAVTGSFVSPDKIEAGEPFKYKRTENWFDGKRWRTPGGQYAKAPKEE